MTILNQSLDAIPVYQVGANGKALTGSTVPSTVDTSLSNTISASGGVTALSLSNTARHEIVNASTGVLWLRWGGNPVVNGAGSFPISPGGSYQVTNASGSLSILSTAASQTFTVNRFTS